MSVTVSTASRSYGPLQPDFQLEIKEGYTALIGKNNIGKSAILQFCFKHMIRNTAEIDSNAACIILPERIIVHESIETQGQTLSHYNDRLAHVLDKQPRAYGEFANDPAPNTLFRLLTHRLGLSRQTPIINELLADMGLPQYDAGDGGAVLFDNSSTIIRQGSGIRSVLTILAALTADSIKYIFIDEPELSLEPEAQKLLKNILVKKSEDSGKSIIVATHSHLFLNRETPENNIVVSQADSGQVKLSPLKSQAELLESTFSLLGNSLSDLFLPDNFIVVEGSSDQEIVNAVIRAKGYENLSLHVHAAGGGPDKVKKKIESIKNTLVTLTAGESPYKLRIVCMLDKPTSEAQKQLASKVENLLDEERYSELPNTSMEEYLPESFYKEAGRNKDDDTKKIKEFQTSGNWIEEGKIKEEVTKAIAKIITSSHLKDIPEISTIIDIAIKKSK